MFAECENSDGIRFSWNVLPSTQLDGQKLHIPIAAIYTPLKPLAGLATVSQKPVACSKCGGILNPYCRVNYRTKTFTCPFCNSGTSFPPHYSAITVQHRPPELYPQCTTIEYVVDMPPTMPPVPNAPPPPPPVPPRKNAFIYVLDTTVVPEELKALTTAVAQSLTLLPPDSYVGLITFGKNVHIWELGFDDANRNFVFRGTKEAVLDHVVSSLSLKPASASTTSASGSTSTSSASASVAGSAPPISGGSFVVPVSDCEVHFAMVLEELAQDPWPQDEVLYRPGRCVGAAMSVAVTLAQAAFKGHNARIMMFVGGPPTEGPGMVVGVERKEPMRQHMDIAKSPYYAEACKYFNKIADQAADSDHIIDLFTCSLDQVGLAEMRQCVERTGGQIVLDDSFTHGTFMGSIKRMFAKDPQTDTLMMGYGADLQVICSPELKIQGAVGQLRSMDRKTAFVVKSASSYIGVGGTSGWKLGGLDYNSSVAVYFEAQNLDKNAQTVANAVGQAQQQQQQQPLPQSYVQFITRYRHPSGFTYIRVTTTTRAHVNMSTPTGLNHIRSSFDQEAAAVALTRWAVHRTTQESSVATMRWLDKVIIKLCGKFGTFTKGKPETFSLPDTFKNFPDLVFHLRRSQLMNVFNSSPDETAFFRMVALRENTSNTALMIQPTLHAFTAEAPQPMPVPLDTSVLDKNRILVLDTFFHVVVWYGSAVHGWRQAGYHLQPEFEHLATFMQAPVMMVAQLMESRFPTPRFIECVERGSQARFLMAKLNPAKGEEEPESKTQGGPAASTGLFAKAKAATSSAVGGAGPNDPEGGFDAPMFSEDVTLSRYLQHLRGFAVQENPS